MQSRALTLESNYTAFAAADTLTSPACPTSRHMLYCGKRAVAGEGGHLSSRLHLARAVAAPLVWLKKGQKVNSASKFEEHVGRVGGGSGRGRAAATRAAGRHYYPPSCREVPLLFVSFFFVG